MHYYILWGLAVWFLAKKSRSLGQFRGMIFLISTGIFLFSFLSMFVSSFFTKNFSSLYFSSWTHIFPFFAGTALATVSGVQNVGANFKKLEQSWSMKQTIATIGGGFVVLILLTFLLRFDNIFTYLVGFLLATIAALAMIWVLVFSMKRHLSWKSRSGSHLLLIRVTVFISSIGLFTLFSVS